MIDTDKRKYAMIANGTVAMVREFSLADAIPDGWVMYRDTLPPVVDADHEAVVSGYAVDALGYCTQNWIVTPKVDTQALPPPPTVPVEVPLWAFRAVLTVRGINTQVDGLIASLPEPDRTVARTQWEFGNYIVRGHPLIAALGAQIGMTTADIDEVFRLASSLK
ncbi:MAG: hypothetical protein DVB31_02950 [Verrucomicrobia bacterium]|nr:MAG: hypothetical protein DVB31_02950 [Verrucomicrobiota bacterium]